MVSKHQKRATKKLRNVQKQRGKFPLLLEKVINDSDIVLEILDARFPKDMQNKEIEKLVNQKGKQLIYVLNKSDLTMKRDKKFESKSFCFL